MGPAAVTFLTSSVEQGLIYGLMALGVYLSFRVLNYADLTVDGSLPMGAAIAAAMIVAGYNPWWATVVALLGGAVAGACTGVVHTYLKITPLLAGILTMTALYSVNLEILGRANVSLLRSPRIYHDAGYLGISSQWAVSVVTLVTVAFIIYVLYLFLQTELGLTIRSTGDNEQMTRSMGVNTDLTKIMGLAMSNALVALAGAYVAQYQGFADVNMGIGTIVAGLASVIVGEGIFGGHTVRRALVAVVLGSVVYRLVIALVLRLGLEPTYLKLMTATLVIIALGAPQLARGMGSGLRSIGRWSK